MEFSKKGLLWTCRAGGQDETIARLRAGCSSPGGDKGSDPDTAKAPKCDISVHHHCARTGAATLLFTERVEASII
jgi:hypothetical protein